MLTIGILGNKRIIYLYIMGTPSVAELGGRVDGVTPVIPGRKIFGGVNTLKVLIPIKIYR